MVSSRTRVFWPSGTLFRSRRLICWSSLLILSLYLIVNRIPSQAGQYRAAPAAAPHARMSGTRRSLNFRPLIAGDAALESACDSDRDGDRDGDDTCRQTSSIVSVVFSRLAQVVCSFLLAPAIRYRYLPRLNELIAYDRKEAMLDTCFQYLDITCVKGDYAEFGLWKGKNLVRAYHLSRRRSWLNDMRFIGFDSFEGIPKLTENRAEAEAFPPGTFAGSYEEVEETLKAGRVDKNRRILVRGWFDDTLTAETREKLKLQTVAIAYVDCDVYQSTVPVLNFLGSCLADGGVIVFDDWYCFGNDQDKGQQKAFAEWLERNPQWRPTPFKEFGCDGKAFIMNRVAYEAKRLAV
jgi:O-methyltransferase